MHLLSVDPWSYSYDYSLIVFWIQCKRGWRQVDVTWSSSPSWIKVCAQINFYLSARPSAFRKSSAVQFIMFLTIPLVTQSKQWVDIRGIILNTWNDTETILLLVHIQSHIIQTNLIVFSAPKCLEIHSELSDWISKRKQQGGWGGLQPFRNIFCTVGQRQHKHLLRHLSTWF